MVLAANLSSRLLVSWRAVPPKKASVKYRAGCGEEDDVSSFPRLSSLAIFSLDVLVILNFALLLS